VTFVDGSPEALALARRNAEANGFEGRCAFHRADAFEVLTAFERAGRRFDVVVLDPPAFVKSRKRLEEGVRGYRDLNARASRLVREGGILATSSCSYHLAWDRFEGMLADAVDARGDGRPFAPGGQGADHPVLCSRQAGYLAPDRPARRRRPPRRDRAREADVETRRKQIAGAPGTRSAG
jgi:23S rRNA (cytosine1962-C5)-methyltransferase